MSCRRVVPALIAVLAGVPATEAAELSVADLIIAPGATDTVVVSGDIAAVAGEETFGVSIWLEILPRGGNTGTVEFTPAAPPAIPVDIVQLGDPWPGAGTFSPFDTDTVGPTLNVSFDDDGNFQPAPVAYTGPLTGFPVIASLDAAGTWDVVLSTSLGDSSWEGIPTNFVNGTITIAAASRLYVDAAAPPGGDGTSWAMGFTDLQEALAVASTNGAISEIWVADGTYTPAGPGGDRTTTFQLISGVALDGGYAGFGAPDPDLRDVDSNASILNGDLNGDDGPNFANNTENSWHVVTGSLTDATAVLDGFTISGGHSDGPRSQGDADGAGMSNENGSPTVTRCTFTGNMAFMGGAGMVNREGSQPVVSNCVFIGNTANFGGGIRNDASDAVLTNCVFTGNTANFAAGVNTAITAHPVLTNCILWGNSVGGVMDEPAQINGGTPTVNYCLIQGWTGDMGGVGNFGGDPQFVAAADVHLLPGSPCVDVGDNAAPGLPSLDFDGESRVQHCRVDLGIDETPYFVDCNTNGAADACDLAVGTSADHNSNGVPDECDECVAAGDCNDGLFCNGTETCDVATCQPGVAPCVAGEWCEEGGDVCVPYGNGDFEPDGDVDLGDYASFQACFGELALAGCAPGNLTGDGTIDLDDYAQFEQALGGP